MRTVIILAFLLLGCSHPNVLKSWPEQQLAITNEISRIAFDYIKGDSSIEVSTYSSNGTFSFEPLHNASFKKQFQDSKFHMLTSLISPDTCTAILLLKSIRPNASGRVHEITFMQLEPPKWSIVNWNIGNE